MLNKILLEGRITKDPILKKTQNGKQYVAFIVANSQKNAEGKEYTDFVPCIAWNKTAELITTYLKKGALISLEGSLSVQNTVADNGCYKTYIRVLCSRIHFLSKAKSEDTNHQNESNEMTELNEEEQNLSVDDQLAQFMEDTDGITDDLPF